MRGRSIRDPETGNEVVMWPDGRAWEIIAEEVLEADARGPVKKRLTMRSMRTITVDIERVDDEGEETWEGEFE